MHIKCNNQFVLDAINDSKSRKHNVQIQKHTDKCVL